MSKHLVKWARPEPLPIKGEFLYRSKCGQYEIHKDHFCSSRGHWNTVAYRFKIVATGKTKTCDTLYDAKLQADWEIDPNWEG